VTFDRLFIPRECFDGKSDIPTVHTKLAFWWNIESKPNDHTVRLRRLRSDCSNCTVDSRLHIATPNHHATPTLYALFPSAFSAQSALSGWFDLSSTYWSTFAKCRTLRLPNWIRDCDHARFHGHSVVWRLS
jgi:hypothetical protein